MASAQDHLQYLLEQNKKAQEETQQKIQETQQKIEETKQLRSLLHRLKYIREDTVACYPVCFPYQMDWILSHPTYMESWQVEWVSAAAKKQNLCLLKESLLPILGYLQKKKVIKQPKKGILKKY